MPLPTEIPIRDFGTLSSLRESTDIGGFLTVAENILLRPYGGIKGPPRYDRLWAIGSSESVETTFRALPFFGFPTGVGTSPGKRNANKTIAIRIYRQGKNFLLMYDLIASKARGLFYLGDDGTYTSGAYDFTAGTATMVVLAIGLDPEARWFGKRLASNLQISNNVNIPVCVQLNRTAVPGIWRQAGSNIAPSAAVLSRVSPASAQNRQARLVFGTDVARRVFTNHTTDTLYTYVATGTVHNVTVSHNYININGFLPTEGMPIILTGTTAPGGLSFNKLYYCCNLMFVLTYLSLMPDGPLIDLTTTGSGVVAWQLDAHGLEDASQVTMGSAGTLPAGLTAIDYFIRDVTTYSFKLAATSGGAVVTFTNNGSLTTDHTAEPVAISPRAGAASLTFTADAETFPGSGGNDKIKVAIINSAYATAIASQRTGSGTIADPYIYTLTTGADAPSSSNDAIVAYVKADTLAVGILSASTSIADATIDTGTWPAAFLVGGIGSGISAGLTSMECSVYLRYFDLGTDNLGYEGVSSDKSNIIVIASDDYTDILVTIPTSPSVVGGRFGFIRVYFQFGDGETTSWNLVGTVANTSGTKTLQVGSTTIIGDVMFADQNQLLPFRDVTMAGTNQVWHGGNTSAPDTLYVSKAAVDDERAPEGASVLNPYRVAIPSQTALLKINALDSDGQKVLVHTNQGVMFLNADDSVNGRHIPQVPVGAANPSCVARAEGNEIIWFGEDLQIWTMAGARYGNRSSKSESADTSLFAMSKADVDRIAREPDRLNAWMDFKGRMFWTWFPSIADNTLISFVYDFQAKGIIGQLTRPKVYAMAQMENDRPEQVFCDEDGNLFVLDSTNQYDWGDDLGTHAAFTPHSVADAPPVQYNGYGYTDYDHDGDGTPSRFYQSVISTIETGFISSGGKMKMGLVGALLASVKGSRAFVEVSVIDKSNNVVTRRYGDIGSLGIKQIHKVMLKQQGESLKLRIRMITAEQKPSILRSASLLYLPAGNH